MHLPEVGQSSFGVSREGIIAMSDNCKFDGFRKNVQRSFRKASRVRIADDAPGNLKKSQRRAFLRAVAAHAVSIPALYYTFAQEAVAANANETPPAGNVSEPTSNVRIVRDFSNAYMELVRLLHEAAEIEHSLMVQYLYAAFSLKPTYADLAGHGDPNSSDLLGVAIEEMQHLAAVNHLLVELGAAPVLVRQDFPYEPDVYPFEMNLEPLSLKSLAKYAYTESPPNALDRSHAKTAQDLLFIEQIDAVLGAEARPNHVGSLYDRVIESLRQYADSSPDFTDAETWIARCEDIKEQGEDGHFQFFKSVFQGSHAAFNGKSVWHLDKSHRDYPSLPLPVNPSAYVGHERQVEDPISLSICWLSNLHYWLSLALLDFGYRNFSQVHREAAQALMMGPLWSLARYLPSRSVGLPFDNLSMGYAPGRDKSENTKFIQTLAQEATALEKKLSNHLPEDYPYEMVNEALEPLLHVPYQTSWGVMDKNTVQSNY